MRSFRVGVGCRSALKRGVPPREGDVFTEAEIERLPKFTADAYIAVMRKAYGVDAVVEVVVEAPEPALPIDLDPEPEPIAAPVQPAPASKPKRKRKPKTPKVEG